MLSERDTQRRGSRIQGQQRPGVGKAGHSRVPFDNPTCCASDLAGELEALNLSPSEHLQRGPQRQIVCWAASPHLCDSPGRYRSVEK
jgi:hypothetical protein